MLAGIGLPVIDADQAAREIVEPGQPAYCDIVREFGAQALTEDGQIDRIKLGKLVFNDPDRLARLNALTHPRVWEVFEWKMQQMPAGTDIVVWDVPLLIETGADSKVDEVWVVWVDDPLQIKRMMHRDGLNETEALSRMAAQMPMEEKMRKADLLIDNRGSLEETRAVVEQCLRDLLTRLSLRR